MKISKMETQRSIIAMKGPPFSRKTVLATLIAKSLNCPVLTLDDVLDVLHPDAFDRSSAPDVAFDILCRMASSHLFKGAFDDVVIDSPLSSRRQLGLLIKLAKSFSGLYPRSRLVIVECKPGCKYSWKLKFEDFLLGRSCSYTRKWYKPTNWCDIEKAIVDSYDNIVGVPKLVVDPFHDLPIFFDLVPSNHPLFIKAIHYMKTREKGDGNNIEIYDLWRKSQYIPPHRPFFRPRAKLSEKEPTLSTTIMDMNKEILCKGGHCISFYSEEGVESDQAYCIACEHQVKGGPAYTCKDCSLALHKDCAESFQDIGVRLSELPASRIFACSSCKENRKTGSRKCATCLLMTNLKAKIMPIVIRHECEKEHFLSLVIPPIKSKGYLCAACGDCDMSDSYSCQICNLAYHFGCLTEFHPRLEHEHGGHHHYMQLKFLTTTVEEDYLCPECQELRDPQLWYYSCEDCPYDAHLYCILPRKERKLPPLSIVEKPFNTPTAQITPCDEEEWPRISIRCPTSQSSNGRSSYCCNFFNAWYFWSTMNADAVDHARKCNACQRHAPIPKKLSQFLHSMLPP